MSTRLSQREPDLARVLVLADRIPRPGWRAGDHRLLQFLSTSTRSWPGWWSAPRPPRPRRCSWRAEQARTMRRFDETLDEVGRLRVSETDARLRMDLLTGHIREMERVVDAITMVLASKLVRVIGPPRRLARRIRRRIKPPSPGPHT